MVIPPLGMWEGEWVVGVGEQAGGYVRVFLEEADERDRELFTESLSEVFSPTVDARYVIQRFVDLKEFSIRGGTCMSDGVALGSNQSL